MPASASSQLEQRIAELAGGAPAAAAPAPAWGTPASPPEAFAPKPAETAPAAASPSERLDEKAVEDIISEASAPPPPPAEPAPPAKSFEERFGASWVVWIGGLALALGGIFMVQYSIEAGLIGPGVRIFLGGLLAAGLVAAGEWARRREIGGNAIYAENAHIPSILTAAGTTVAFATIYAAYALYEFLVPGTAFVLLGIVALATLAASLLHGPALAALGQVGAFVVPALVASPRRRTSGRSTSIWRSSRRRPSRSRVRGCGAGSSSRRWWRRDCGCFPASITPSAITPHAFHAVVSFALCAALIVSGLFYGPARRGRPHRRDLVGRACRVPRLRRHAGARLRP